MRDIDRLKLRVDWRISSECVSTQQYGFIYISESHYSEHLIDPLSYQVHVKIHYQNKKSNQELFASVSLHYYK